MYTGPATSWQIAVDQVKFIRDRKMARRTSGWFTAVVAFPPLRVALVFAQVVRLPGARVLLSELLTADRIKVPLASRTKNDLLRELVELVTRTYRGGDPESILASVREREMVLSTGIGGGVAIPHGKTPQVDQLLLAAGVAPEPIDFDALDGKPVHLFFLLVGPESAAGAHVKALSRISRLLRREQLRADLIASASPEHFLRIVRDSEAA